MGRPALLTGILGAAIAALGVITCARLAARVYDMGATPPVLYVATAATLALCVLGVWHATRRTRPRDERATKVVTLALMATMIVVAASYSAAALRADDLDWLVIIPVPAWILCS